MTFAILLISAGVGAGAMILSFATSKIVNAISTGRVFSSNELARAGRRIWISIACAVLAAAICTWLHEGFIAAVWVAFLIIQYINLQAVEQAIKISKQS